MKRRRNTRWLDVIVVLNFASAWWCALAASGSDKITVLPLAVSMVTVGLLCRWDSVTRQGDND